MIIRSGTHGINTPKVGEMPCLCVVTVYPWDVLQSDCSRVILGYVSVRSLVLARMQLHTKVFKLGLENHKFPAESSRPNAKAECSTPHPSSLGKAQICLRKMPRSPSDFLEQMKL